MKINRTEKGQALILIAFGIIALLAMTGLAVDASATYSNRQDAQNAADSAALTAALDLANSKTSLSTDAQASASTNGFNNNGTSNTVAVNNPPLASAACSGTLPTFPNSSTQYVQVVIKSTVNTTFGSLVGIKQTHNCVDAIARGQSGTTGSMFGGAGIVATDNASGCNQTMLFNGSAYVTVNNAGIFDNCGGGQALLMNSSVTLDMDSNAQVVGGDLLNGGPTIIPGITTGAVGYTMPAAAWSSIPAVPTAPTCSSSGNVTGTYSGTFSGGTLNMNSGTPTLTPGNFSGLNINGGTLTFSPGTYCINGSVNMNGGGLVGASGLVNLVMANGLNLNGGVSLTFDDLEIYTTNGNWILNSGASMTGNKLRFYSNGSSTFTVNGSATLTASNSFFYLTSGNVVWNGSSNINLQAPPTGDPYAGLVLYMPWSNTSSLILNGGSNVTVTGTILAPHSGITANGNSNFKALNSQIVGYTFIFNGGGTFTVTFNANQNYGTPTTALVELFK
jgi:Flp pilus assembly protein TadG